MSEPTAQTLPPDEIARSQRLAQVWALVFDGIRQTLNEIQTDDRDAHMWMTMGLVASLVRHEPFLLIEVWEHMERGGFPFYVEEMLTRTLADLRAAIVGGPDAAA